MSTNGEASPRVAVVTGAAGRIGRSTALALGREGLRVWLLDRDAEVLKSAAAELRSAVTADIVTVDVRDAEAVRRAIDMVVAECGRVDQLFCSAGAAHDVRCAAAEMEFAVWTGLIESHLSTVFHVCQAVLPHMVERGAGSVVIMCSDFSISGMARGAHYAAAKAALYSLTKCLAVEFAGNGIRVNAVGPGPIDTPFLTAGYSPGEREERLAMITNRVPMGRLGRPREVADTVAFLLSEQASYLTGQLVQPNGGQVMW